MTENEIILALRCCVSTDPHRCQTCPADPIRLNKRGCGYVMVDAADAIARLREERKLLDKRIADQRESNAKLHAQVSGLKAELASYQQVKRERDAAVKDIEAVITHYTCYVCKHSQSGYGYGCDIATDLKDKLWDCAEHHRFEWRGVCAGNGGVST